MDRGFALGPAGRRHIGGAGGRGALARRRRQLLPGALRAPAAALRALRSRRRLRIAAICAVLAAPLLGGGWLWLRHSPLVAVDHVQITGVHGAEAHAIETALREAAKGMSTLDVQPGALRAAVARFPAVAAVRALPSFPHSLRIEVTQQPPVAALLVGGTRTAISAGGVVLGTSLLSGSLPTVADDVAPDPGSRVSDTLVLQALAVLGAAPPALDRLAEKAFFSTRGLTVQMRDGLLVYFGDATRPHAKWLALASVLADKSSAGASYVDVRLPGKPAAGFPAGAGPSRPEEEATGESLQRDSESTVSALAAGLAAANPETKKSEPEEAPGTGEAGSAASPSEGAEASGAAGSEAATDGSTGGG